MSERTTIKTDDGEFSAYVARPAAAKAPAIVVIQEIFGVNAFIRQTCDRLAAQGYLAIAPDLFWRITPGIDITDKEMDKAFGYFGQFDKDKGVADIQATIDHVRKDPGCNGKVGAVGYCLGGFMAARTALETNVDAAVGYYGVSLDSLASQAAGLKAPLMLHIAEEDGFVPKDAQAKIKAAFGANSKAVLHSYPGRDHAFARDGGDHFHQADAYTANNRTMAFFAEHIG